MEQKIIIEGWPNDNEILLDEVTCRYIQEPNCTEDREGDSQEIIISSRDGGGGKFINMQTKSWSISEPEDILIVLNDFKKRINESFSNS